MYESGKCQQQHHPHRFDWNCMTGTQILCLGHHRCSVKPVYFLQTTAARREDCTMLRSILTSKKYSYWRNYEQGRVSLDSKKKYIVTWYEGFHIRWIFMTIDNCKENEIHYKIKLCPAQQCYKKDLFKVTAFKDIGYVNDKKSSIT